MSQPAWVQLACAAAAGAGSFRLRPRGRDLRVDDILLAPRTGEWFYVERLSKNGIRVSRVANQATPPTDLNAGDYLLYMGYAERPCPCCGGPRRRS